MVSIRWEFSIRFLFCVTWWWTSNNNSDVSVTHLSIPPRIMLLRLEVFHKFWVLRKRMRHSLGTERIYMLVEHFSGMNDTRQTRCAVNWLATQIPYFYFARQSGWKRKVIFPPSGFQMLKALLLTKELQKENASDPWTHGQRWSNLWKLFKVSELSDEIKEGNLKLGVYGRQTLEG